MIRLDKIKIVSSLNNISNINENEFKTIIKDGIILEQSFSMLSPYSLYIEADYEENELVIEITGKVLKDSYYKLINRDTIRQCFHNINDMNLCTLNIDGILSDGKVVKCDVTRDVIYPNCQKLSDIKANVRSYKKYQVKTIGNNLEITKSVKTKTCKCRLIIYDKEKEMHLATNREFLSSCKDGKSLLNYFNGKVRFELNLNSMKQIRKFLNISETSIDSVLSSTSTPIWDFIDKSISDDCFNNTSSLTELKNKLILDYCDRDLEKVEALLRNHYSPNTHISQVMKPYKTLMKKLSENHSPNLKGQLKNLLT